MQIEEGDTELIKDGGKRPAICSSGIYDLKDPTSTTRIEMPLFHRDGCLCGDKIRQSQTVFGGMGVLWC